MAGRLSIDSVDSLVVRISSVSRNYIRNPTRSERQGHALRGAGRRLLKCNRPRRAAANPGAHGRYKRPESICADDHRHKTPIVTELSACARSHLLSSSDFRGTPWQSRIALAQDDVPLAPTLCMMFDLWSFTTGFLESNNLRHFRTGQPLPK